MCAVFFLFLFCGDHYMCVWLIFSRCKQTAGKLMVNSELWYGLLFFFVRTSKQCSNLIKSNLYLQQLRIHQMIKKKLLHNSQSVFALEYILYVLYFSFFFSLLQNSISFLIIINLIRSISLSLVSFIRDDHGNEIGWLFLELIQQWIKNS